MSTHKTRDFDSLVSVRLTPETLERLSVLAQTMQRPRAWLMARAIERFVEQEAWQIEAIQQAVARHDSGEARVRD